MSTSTSVRVAAEPARRAGFGAVVRSEVTKLFSVRSTLWTLLALLAVTIGFSALICAATGHSDPRHDATSQSLVGLFFGQVAAVVLGALCITTEYSKGGIRTTLTAVPNRLRLLGAKALVVAATLAATSLVAVFASFFLGQSLLAGHDADVGLGDPHVLRAVLGGALYLVASGLFGFALGVLLRQSAGAITGGLVLLFVAPPLVGLIPGSAGSTISRYFTSNAGRSILMAVRDPETLSPWGGYAVFTLWWVIPLAIGAALMVRRDAA